MFDSLRSLALRWLRVPAEPHPPAGAPDSVRIFRAARKFYTLRLLVWTLGQAAALTAVIFWATLFFQFKTKVEQDRLATATPALQSAPDSPEKNPSATDSAGKARPRRRPSLSAPGQLAARFPSGLMLLFEVLEVFGFLSFLAQFLFTYAVLRLDFEQRWYIVTDRSLRIRSGLWRMQEMTMSFANLQQVVITRGPIQGWLKISDVRVQSAGGGAGPKEGGGQSLHAGVFHGVDNAQEIRDLILERLRRFRATGLGDPEDRAAEINPSAASSATASRDNALAAARELLDEARHLRAAL